MLAALTARAQDWTTLEVLGIGVRSVSAAFGDTAVPDDGGLLAPLRAFNLTEPVLAARMSPELAHSGRTAVDILALGGLDESPVSTSGQVVNSR